MKIDGEVAQKYRTPKRLPGLAKGKIRENGGFYRLAEANPDRRLAVSEVKAAGGSMR